MAREVREWPGGGGRGENDRQEEEREASGLHEGRKPAVGPAMPEVEAGEKARANGADKETDVV